MSIQRTALLTTCSRSFFGACCMRDRLSGRHPRNMVEATFTPGKVGVGGVVHELLPETSLPGATLAPHEQLQQVARAA